MRIEAPPSPLVEVGLDRLAEPGAFNGRSSARRANTAAEPCRAQWGTTMAASWVLDAPYGYWSAEIARPAARASALAIFAQAGVVRPQLALAGRLQVRKRWTGSPALRPMVMTSSIDRSRPLNPRRGCRACVDPVMPGDDPGQLDQLVGLRVSARQVDQAGRHPPRPGDHPPIDQGLHLFELFGVG